MIALGTITTVGFLAHMISPPTAASVLTSTDINTPAFGATREVTPYRAYDISSFGTEFGCHESKCRGRFVWREITGDFDIRCRVASVTNSAGHCAAAGLMARVSTDPQSPFVKIVANSFNRTWKEYDPIVMGARYKEGGHLPQDDSWLGGYWYCIPRDRVNADIPFPNVWLRLVRRGSEFTAYFAQTVGVPTEADWRRDPITFALGGGPEGPTFRDSWGVYPRKMLVGLCLEANVEGNASREAFASFREIHGLAPVKAEPQSAATVETGRVAEVSFVSSKPRNDPFNEISLDVVFTDPEGSMFRVPAFWAGENVWRARYSSRLPGRHTYRTECTDHTDAGLHGKNGEVAFVAYEGDNPLYKHGPVRVSEDRRHFAHADGTPFFWLGDTWWMGLTKRLRWLDEFGALTRDRRAKGFSVILLTAGLYGDLDRNFDERAEGDGGHPWTQDFAHVRPEYFDAADARIMHLVEQEMVPCVVGSWGYWLTWLGKEKIKQHWRYLVARWGALPVVWCAAGETTMPWYLSEKAEEEAAALRRDWSDVIRYVRWVDPFKRLVSTHAPHARHSPKEVDDPALVDFNLQQSGHGTPPPGQAAMALEGWNLTPAMPSLSGEARYEKLTLKPEWVADGAGLPRARGLTELGTREARQAFWAHVLYSGCSGHTYGASGIFQVNRPDWKFGQAFSGVDWGQLSWQEAMDLPGSKQIGIGAAMLRTLPWHRMVPAETGFAGATAAAITRDSRCAVAYTHSGSPIHVALDRFTGDLRAHWFDPTTGKTLAISGSPFPSRGSRVFTPPGPNAAGDLDWVLLIEQAQ